MIDDHSSRNGFMLYELFNRWEPSKGQFVQKTKISMERQWAEWLALSSYICRKLLVNIDSRGKDRLHGRKLVYNWESRKFFSLKEIGDHLIKPERKHVISQPDRVFDTQVKLRWSSTVCDWSYFRRFIIMSYVVLSIIYRLRSSWIISSRLIDILIAIRFLIEFFFSDYTNWISVDKTLFADKRTSIHSLYSRFIENVFLQKT